MGMINYSDIVKPPVVPVDLLDKADFASQRYWSPTAGDTTVAGWLSESGFALTRATTAHRVRSDGLLESVASGAMRLTWDATDIANDNLHTASAEDMSLSAWVKARTTVSTDQTAAPDGAIRADAVVETTENNTHGIYQVHTASAATYIWSIYLKPNGRNILMMYAFDGATSTTAVTRFDLSTGEYQLMDSNLSMTAGTVAAGNGWYRCWIKFTYTAGHASNRVQATFFDGRSLASPGASSYAGLTSKGVYAWGSQFTLGSTLLDYMGEPLGFLLEGAGTNIALQSQTLDNASWVKTRTSITANAAVAPDGTTTADKLKDDATAAASHYMTFTPTGMTAAAVYTQSFYIKAAEYASVLVAFYGNPTTANLGSFRFNASTGVFSSVSTTGAFTQLDYGAEKLPNGWWRVWQTVQTSGSDTGILFRINLIDNANGSSYNGDSTSGVYLWGMQLELGGLTSYIPTTTTSVTRNADAFSRSWTPPSEYTVLLEFKTPDDISTQATRVIWSVGSSGTDVMYLFIGALSADFYLQAKVSNSFTVNITLTDPPIPGTVQKIAIRVDSGDVAVSVDGGAVDTSSQAVPATTNEALGSASWSLGGGPLNGTIKKRVIYDRAFTNAELMALAA